jgi:drug/metabolite transporter (DMT)-like permease
MAAPTLRLATDERRGAGLSVLSVFIVSAGPLANKFVLGYFSAPAASILTTLATTVLAVAFVLARSRRLPLSLRPKLWLVGLFEGAGVICMFASLTLVSPVVIGFINRLSTVFAVVLGIWIFGERIRKTEALLICAAVAGALMFVDSGMTAASAVGLGLAVLYTAFFVVSNAVAKSALSAEGAMTVLLYSKGGALMTLLLFGAMTGGWSGVVASPTGVAWVTLSAAISVVGLGLGYAGLRYLDFAKANALRSFGPVLISLYAWPFFPVRLTPLNVGGALTLVIAVAVLAYRTDTSRGAAAARANLDHV